MRVVRRWEGGKGGHSAAPLTALVADSAAVAGNIGSHSCSGCNSQVPVHCPPLGRSPVVLPAPRREGQPPLHPACHLPGGLADQEAHIQPAAGQKWPQ